MADYTLYYWPVPFRGQPIRAVLAHVGASWEEMDAEDKREEEELEAEHKRLLTSRLARARSASGNSGDSLTSAKPDDDHDDDDGLEQDRV